MVSNSSSVVIPLSSDETHAKGSPSASIRLKFLMDSGVWCVYITHIFSSLSAVISIINTCTYYTDNLRALLGRAQKSHTTNNPYGINMRFRNLS